MTSMITCRGCASIPLAKAQMRAYGARFEQMTPGGREKGTLEREDEEMK